MRFKIKKMQSIFLIMVLVLSLTNVTFALGVSTTPSTTSITITNNAGLPDIIKVSSLTAGDIVKVYRATTPERIGTAIIAVGMTEGVVYVPQLGSDAGSIFVSVTSVGKSESDKVEKTYIAEVVSTDPVATNITITNNPSGTADTVRVTSLAPGDVVKVYKDNAAAIALGSSTVVAWATEATVLIPQVGTTTGSIFVTVTSIGKKCSTRVEKTFISEVASTDPLSSNITVTNNVTGTADTVKVTALSAGDVVRVYRDAITATPIKTAKVTGWDTEATVSIPQLGTKSGSVFVTVTSEFKGSSARVEKAYLAEKISDPILSTNIAVTNNSGIADTIKVTGLAAKDIVRVYATPTDTKALGTAKVAANNTEATVSVSQIGAGDGKLYVSVTSVGKLESTTTEVTFIDESASDDPSSSSVLVINNKGKDLVIAYGLKPKDVVKIYSTSIGGTAIGTATVAANQSQVIIAIAQLGAAGGDFYFTVTNAGKLESNRVNVTFPAE